MDPKDPLEPLDPALSTALPQGRVKELGTGYEELKSLGLPKMAWV